MKGRTSQTNGKSWIVRMMTMVLLIWMLIPLADVAAERTTGTASYYSSRFNGRRTSSGEVLDNNLFTAAHASLPFGTLVRVTNVDNGKSVIVRVTDRFSKRNPHLMDLTQAAAKEIDMMRFGLANIRIEVLDDAEAIKLVDTGDAFSGPGGEDTVTYALPVKSVCLEVANPSAGTVMPAEL
ncbi:MAG: septal ring lytic transglycosylase RlpA family protein [Bacteroidota bacterium]|nr:septal ring lytic transglycosylase RlpA family protein [Bacteroidota bacterium]